MYDCYLEIVQNVLVKSTFLSDELSQSDTEHENVI